MIWDGVDQFGGGAKMIPGNLDLGWISSGEQSIVEIPFEGKGSAGLE